MNAQTIFFIVWVIGATYALTTLYRKGKKALSIFPDIGSVRVVYRDKWASGYSAESFITRAGGAKKVLDIVVTDKELWLKSMILFAGVGNQYDLVHRIPLEQIIEVNRQGKQVTVDFELENGQTKRVVLVTKRLYDFLSALEKGRGHLERNVEL